jgi:hypothetical protein
MDAQDRQMLDRQAQFRLAADAVTAALAGVPEVEAVALIFAGIAHPTLIQPLEKVTADIAHALAELDEGRTTTTAAKSRECGFRAASDQ